MTPAIPRDLLAELSGTVAAYLNVVSATAVCLEETYPDVGGVYRQRMERLRSRVAYHATREAITESAQTLAAELKDYALVTNRVLSQRSIEMTRGILDLGDMMESLAKCQEIFSHQLRQLADQVESGSNPVETASRIRSLMDAMSDDANIASTQLREQMTVLDQRLAGTTSVDPATGLINRRELERQVEARKLHGSPFTILVFELSGGPLSDQVFRQAGARLSANFRHPDWTARWNPRELAVLFVGPPELAQTRGAQAVQSIVGTYTLESGATVVVEAGVRALEPELAPA